MQRLIIFLLFLLASVWLGVVLVQHPSSVYFILPPWSVEMPLWFFVLSALILFLIFYLLLRTMHSIGFSWYRLKNWWHYRSEHRSYSKTQQGFLALIEHRWAQAETLLLDGVALTLEPLINYLGAAKAAFSQQAYERCDKYLHKAHQVAPKAEVAIGIMRAQFQLQRDQLEQALATLNHLRQLAPKQAQVLSLLERVYTRLADWGDLLKLIPYLQQAHVLTKDQTLQLEKNIYCELLRQAGAKQDSVALWEKIPRTLQKNDEVVLTYVQQNQAIDVENLIKQALRKHWSPALVTEYGKLRLPDSAKQLATAERWLSHHGNSAELYIALARISFRCQLWGKARDYYEQGLSKAKNTEASLEYGTLLEQLGERDAALEAYKRALGP